MRILACVFAAASLLCLAGCGDDGPPVGEVFGRVTYRGQPVTEGTVEFFSDVIPYAADAQLEKDGSYRIDAPREGRC